MIELFVFIVICGCAAMVYSKFIPYIEIKKSATLDKNDVKQFHKLETFKMPVGVGGLVSLYPQRSHITEDILTIPATML